MTIEEEEEEDTCEEEMDFETWDEDEAAIEDDFDSAFFETLSEAESVAARRVEDERKRGTKKTGKK